MLHIVNQSCIIKIVDLFSSCHPLQNVKNTVHNIKDIRISKKKKSLSNPLFLTCLVQTLIFEGCPHVESLYQLEEDYRFVNGPAVSSTK